MKDQRSEGSEFDREGGGRGYEWREGGGSGQESDAGEKEGRRRKDEGRVRLAFWGVRVEGTRIGIPADRKPRSFRSLKRGSRKAPRLVQPWRWRASVRSAPWAVGTPRPAACAREESAHPGQAAPPKSLAPWLVNYEKSMSNQCGCHIDFQWGCRSQRVLSREESRTRTESMRWELARVAPGMASSGRCDGPAVGDLAYGRSGGAASAVASRRQGVAALARARAGNTRRGVPRAPSACSSDEHGRTRSSCASPTAAHYHGDPTSSRARTICSVLN